MHLYILTRGQKNLIDKWIKHLECQYFTHQTGITPDDLKMLQMGVRPIQLYELAFPKEHLQEVLRTIQPMGFEGENKTSKIRMIMDKVCWTIRRILKLQDIPKWDISAGPRRILGSDMERSQIDIRGVGIKEDKKGEIELV